MTARPRDTASAAADRRRGPWAWPWDLAAILAVAAAARIFLAARFPLFLTADSPDYLLAAEKIATDLDFLNRHLGDWRLPGYPVFLALVHRLAPWTASSVVAAQTIVGLATVVLGMVAGRLAAGRLGAVVLGLFLALHPAYLLFEHMLMTESLFTFLLWAVAVACLALVKTQGDVGFSSGLLLGGLVGLCLLTRANGLFYCVPLVAGTFLLRVMRPAGSGRPAVGHHLALVVGFSAALVGVMGPWVVRNVVFLGKPTLFADNTQRNRLIFLAEHGLLRTDLSQMQPYRYDPDRPAAIYDLILNELPAKGAESRASRILSEQLAAQKTEYLREVGVSFLHLLGLPRPARNHVAYWFDCFASDLPRLRRHNLGVVPPASSFVLDLAGRGGRAQKAWTAIGLAWLRWGRAVLTLALAVALTVFLLGRGLDRREGGDKLVLLAAVLLTVIGFQALLLADHQRYVLPFEGLWVLLGAGVGSRLGWRRGGPRALA